MKSVIYDAETYETVYTVNNLEKSTSYYWKVYAKMIHFIITIGGRVSELITCSGLQIPLCRIKQI